MPDSGGGGPGGFSGHGAQASDGRWLASSYVEWRLPDRGGYCGCRIPVIGVAAVLIVGLAMLFL